MICRTCLDDPCTCSDKHAVRTWLLRECAAEGCFVVLRTLPGEPQGPSFCKWHQDGQAHPCKRTRSHAGPFMSREEFGADLYEVVKLCGGLMQKRSADLQQQLAQMLPKLSVADQEAIVTRYPDLFAGPI